MSKDKEEKKPTSKCGCCGVSIPYQNAVGSKNSTIMCPKCQKESDAKLKKFSYEK
jgi:Zn finger protein HypA/HybF involved in hydrogenase expression